MSISLGAVLCEFRDFPRFFFTSGRVHMTRISILIGICTAFPLIAVRISERPTGREGDIIENIGKDISKRSFNYLGIIFLFENCEYWSIG